MISWPWPPRPPSPEPPPPDNPVLLIPGICGSILNVRSQGDTAGSGNRVWVCVTHADLEYQKLWGKFNPDTGLVEVLQNDLEVIVPTNPSGDDGGLYAVDVLDPQVYFPLHVIYYYHGLISFLKSNGYTAAKDLFGFGYDFRQSNRQHAAALLAKLEATSAACGGRRVDIVSHSMGGLVVKALLAEYPDDFARLVNKWVAIACPWRGAPGFIQDALLTGVQFVAGWEQYFFVEKSTMHTLITQAPSVYELMPAPDYDWGKLGAPTTSVWMRPDGAAAATREVYPLGSYRDLLRKTLEGHQVTVNGEAVDLSMNEALWPWAAESKTRWAAARLPPSCKLFTLYGTGVATAFHAKYGSEAKPLRDYPDIMQQYAFFDYVDGDGTVPKASAMDDGLEASERVGMLGDHRGLLEQAGVYAQVLQWLQQEDAEPEVEGDWVMLAPPKRPRPPLRMPPLADPSPAALHRPARAAPPGAVPPPEGGPGRCNIR